MRKFFKYSLTIIFVLFIVISSVLLFSPKEKIESFKIKLNSFVKQYVNSDNIHQKDIIERNDLVSKISPDSPIFIVWDSSTEQYKKIHNKNLGFFHKRAYKFFSKNVLFEFVEDFLASELMDNIASDAKGVFFIEEYKNYKYQKEKFPFAVYVDLLNRINANNLKQKISDFLKKMNYKYEVSYIGGLDIINVMLKNEDENFHIKFFINDNGLAISNKVELIERYLNKNYNSGYIKKLFHDESFNKTYQQALKENATCFSLAVMLINVTAGLNPVFTDKIISTQSFDNNNFYINKIVLPYNASDSISFQLINAFNSQNNHTKTFPLGVNVSFNISKSLIDFLKFVILTINEREKYNFFNKYKNLFDIKNLNFLIQSPNGLRTPGIAIVGNKVGNYEKAVNDFKNMLLDFGVINDYNFQKKNINNLSSEYFLKSIYNDKLKANIDFGIYIVRDGDDYIISNSENLIIDLISNSSKIYADKMKNLYQINSQSIFNMFLSPKSISSSLMEVLQDDIMKDVSLDFIKSLADALILFNQLPDFVVDIYAINNNLVFENKMVLGE